jgi:periplasmic protein TonB
MPTKSTLTATLFALLAGCASSPLPTSSPPVPSSPAPSSRPIVTAPGVPAPSTAPLPPSAPSRATTPKDYRRDAASHLYARNAHRIFKGQLPPMLHAVGVLDVEVDRNGRVMALNWLRAPKHAPEVMTEIERTVRQAEPYPAPTRMGRVTYTDIWLWHESGKFQLDTLTEGQL